MKPKTEQKYFKDELIDFISKYIRPNTKNFEEKEAIPATLIKKLGEKGYLGANIPEKYGGSNYSAWEIGMINELFSKECPSIRSIFTVQGMISLAILKWGTETQKEKWLPLLASGDVIGAFALAEATAGSDAGGITANYELYGDSFRINAKKTWVTLGQIATLYLVFAVNNGQHSAFLIENNRPGITVKKMEGLLGMRSSMIAKLCFEDCVIPTENLLGVEGAGLRHIVPSCLDYGRFTVAWGCVGICQACLDYALNYSSERKQFGSYINQFELIQGMLAEMISKTKAARLLCESMNNLRDEGSPNSIVETCLAKYFASKTVNDVASKAVQIYGANGCINDYPIEGFYRDAKITEIIEGSTQILEILIANNYF